MPPRLRSTVLFTVVAVLLSLPSAAQATAAPSYTMEERAAAIASPALVFIQARTDGFLRSKATGQVLHDAPITVVHRCSGFAVATEGYVVSTTRCVRPSVESLHGSASSILANRLIRDERLASEQKDAYVEELDTTAAFTVSDGDAFPETRIYGQLFQGWGGLTTLPAFAGRVVESRSAATSDTSLIKFEYEKLSVVEIGGDQLDIDMAVVLMGFGTTDTALDSATYTVRTRAARIVGRIADKTPPLYKLDGEIGDFSHGGMIVDASGRLVGMINDDTSAKSRVNRAAMSMAPIKALLNEAGVSNTLTPRDQTYRAGLDAYFGGRYSEAIERLDTVTEAVPSHTVAKTYRQNASQRLAIEGDAVGDVPAWATSLIVALTIIVIILAALLILFLVRRRSPKVPVAAVPYYVPISGIPISAVPVSGPGLEDYVASTSQSPWQQSDFAVPLALPANPAPSQDGDTAADLPSGSKSAHEGRSADDLDSATSPWTPDDRTDKR